jgi:class 3 adenylate cyclase
MDTPQIQYARTADGVNIAYYAIGSGPPLVYLVAPGSHLEAEWRRSIIRAGYEAAARRSTFIRLDPRGFGLSDRSVNDFSLDAMVSDIEAVADKLSLSRFTVYGNGMETIPAIAYAARHQDRVTNVVLSPPACRSDDLGNERLMALRELVKADWELGSATIIRSFYPTLPDAVIADLGQLFAEAVDVETLFAVTDSSDAWDADKEAASLRIPTLLIHDRSDMNTREDATRRVAGIIPTAKVAFIDGPTRASAVVRDFLYGDAPSPPKGTPKVPPSGTAVILFADIADSTALTERLGDAAFREKTRELDAALRTIIREANGTAIEGKLLGDGELAVFTSARQAIEAALRCGAAGDDAGLPLHLGLHAGDVIEEDGNVFGGAVNIAARIAGESAAGEVLVSATVRDLARTSAGVTFEDAGERELKGVSDPVRIWRVAPS